MVSAGGRPVARQGLNGFDAPAPAGHPAIVYLTVGLLVGPTVLNVFHFNPLQESALLEVLTEVAVLISLFSAGVKMPAPVSFTRWRAPILLASVSMTVSVGMVAAFAYYLLSLHWVRVSCWAQSSRPPIRCWQPMSRPVIPVIETSCALH